MDYHKELNCAVDIINPLTNDFSISLLDNGLFLGMNTVLEDVYGQYFHLKLRLMNFKRGKSISEMKKNNTMERTLKVGRSMIN